MAYKEIIHISYITGRDIGPRQGHKASTGDFDNNCSAQVETIEFDLEILDESVLFCIDVKPKMIKLSEVVPLAYKISSKISNFIEQKNINEGIEIPCQKGCATCCSYLVPVSIPEAFHLKETFMSLPENTRRPALTSFLKSAKRILNKTSKEICSIELDDLSKWYSQLNLTCPFLSDNTCSIYDNRPIACREYLVTDSPLSCNPTQNLEPRKTELPVSIIECLGKLSAELKQTDIEAIMMPLALLWVNDNPDSDIETWYSRDIIRRFTEIIKESSEIFTAAQLC